MAVYRYKDTVDDTILMISNMGNGHGIHIVTELPGVVLPDDEIPALISALQDYMSRRAKQLSRAANESR